MHSTILKEQNIISSVNRLSSIGSACSGHAARHRPHQYSVAACITASTRAHSSHRTDDSSRPLILSQPLATSSRRHGQHSPSSSSSTQCRSLHSRKYQGALITQDRRSKLFVQNYVKQFTTSSGVISDAIFSGIILSTVFVHSYVISCNSSLRLIGGAH